MRSQWPHIASAIGTTLLLYGDGSRNLVTSACGHQSSGRPSPLPLPASFPIDYSRHFRTASLRTGTLQGLPQSAAHASVDYQ